MLFSVIVPMYNVKSYAKCCIESILNQSYTDFELILVDDGSTDGTDVIIDKYAQKDSRINVVHKSNGGLTSARKAGAQIAKGEYVAIVDGDDWIGKDYLQEFYSAIKNDDPDVIICGYRKYGETYEEEVKVTVLEPGIYFKDSEKWKEFKEHNLMKLMPTVWAKCFKRESYSIIQNKIEDRISMGEDGCISYPLLASANTVTVVNATQYYYRFNPNSLTNNKSKIIYIEPTVWRISHLKNNLPKSKGISYQMAGFSAHALFNAVFTNMRSRKYREVVIEADEALSSAEVAPYFCNTKVIGSKWEKIVHFVLKKRWYILIKCYVIYLNIRGK